MCAASERSARERAARPPATSTRKSVRVTRNARRSARRSLGRIRADGWSASTCGGARRRQGDGAGGGIGRSRRAEAGRSRETGPEALPSCGTRVLPSRPSMSSRDPGGGDSSPVTRSGQPGQHGLGLVPVCAARAPPPERRRTPARRPRRVARARRVRASISSSLTSITSPPWSASAARISSRLGGSAMAMPVARVPPPVPGRRSRGMPPPAPPSGARPYDPGVRARVRCRGRANRSRPGTSTLRGGVSPHCSSASIALRPVPSKNAGCATWLKWNSRVAASAARAGGGGAIALGHHTGPHHLQRVSLGRRQIAGRVHRHRKPGARGRRSRGQRGAPRRIHDQPSRSRPHRDRGERVGAPILEGAGAVEILSLPEEIVVHRIGPERCRSPDVRAPDRIERGIGEPTRARRRRTGRDRPRRCATSRPHAVQRRSFTPPPPREGT